MPLLMTSTLATFGTQTFGLTDTAALATVALLGYVVGCVRRPESVPLDEQAERAATIARELEGIASRLRRELAKHHNEVERFRLGVESSCGSDEQDEQLTAEVERVLGPTLRLAAQVAEAYDRIRQQTDALAQFDGGRLDTETQLYNDRGLEQLIDIHLRSSATTNSVCSMVLFQPNAIEEEKLAEQSLAIAGWLRRNLRGQDSAARLEDGRLAVFMPSTPLTGTPAFWRRFSRSLRDELHIEVAGGATCSLPGDSTSDFLQRAYAALEHTTKEEGSLILHTGQELMNHAHSTIAS